MAQRIVFAQEKERIEHHVTSHGLTRPKAWANGWATSVWVIREVNKSPYGLQMLPRIEAGEWCRLQRVQHEA